MKTPPYRRLLDYLAGGSGWIKYFRYLLLCLKYLKKRFLLREVFRHLGLAGIAAPPECVSLFLPGGLLIRRFTYGFQRFWERVAWDLNVRLNVEIKAIKRSNDGITVTYTHPIQMIGNQVPHTEDTTQFDYLIIACPLLKNELE